MLNWDWVDPVLTLLIAGYILYLSSGMLRHTSRILMEGTPRDLDLQAVQRSIESIPGIVDLHHLHVWELDENHRALEAHLAVTTDALQRFEAIKCEAKRVLAEQYLIHHSTLEFEIAGEACSEPDRSLISRHR